MGIALSGIGWLIARVGTLAITWAASLYFVRALVNPQGTLGTFYVFETIISFLVLFSNGGLNAAIVKRVSEGEAAARYAGAGILLSVALLLFFTVGVVIAAPLLVQFFGFAGISVILVVGTMLAYQMKDTSNAILSGQFKVGRSGLVDFINGTSQVLFQVSLVGLGFGALALMAGYMAGTIVAGLVAAGLVLRRIRPAKPTREDLESVIDFARYSFLNNFVQKFYDNIDIIVITVLIGKAATGVYGIGFRFSLIIVVFYSAINRVSFPEISQHSSAGNVARVKEVLSDSLVLGLLIGLPALAGFVVMARPIIVTFYTGTFAAATGVAIGAVATRVPEGLRSSFDTVLNSIDRPDIAFRGGLILLIANLVLDLVLVPTIGIVGAVVASFIGITLQFLYLFRHVVTILDLSAGDFPLKDIGIETLAAAVMAGAVYWLREVVGPSTAVEVFGLVGVGVMVYFGIVLTIGHGIRIRIVAILQDMVPSGK